MHGGRRAHCDGDVGPHPVIIKAGNYLIPIEQIKSVDIADIEQESITIRTIDGTIYTATGFDAIEALMVLKPSAMEGRRLKWRKGAWAFHNIVGHPLIQVMAWLGFGAAAVRFHDWTTPRPR